MTYIDTTVNRRFFITISIQIQAWYFVLERGKAIFPSLGKGHLYEYEYEYDYEEFVNFYCIGTFERAPRQRPGATEAIASVASIKYQALLILLLFITD